MKVARWVAINCVFASLCACGGLGEPGTSFTVLPRTATVAKGATLKIAMVVANADVDDYWYSVEGGAANGTVAAVFNDHARAVYTAPQTSGVYTVNASFRQFGGKVYSTTVSVTVP